MLAVNGFIALLHLHKGKAIHHRPEQAKARNPFYAAVEHIGLLKKESRELNSPSTKWGLSLKSTAKYVV